LYTNYNEKISNIISKTNLPKENLVLSEEYDIIIPTSGETAIDLATASCVMKEGIDIGGDTNIIKTKENSLFLS
jgi:type I restriction enzyme S subunit